MMIDNVKRIRNIYRFTVPMIMDDEESEKLQSTTIGVLAAEPGTGIKSEQKSYTVKCGTSI
jgi:hypothetical protein